MGLLGNFSGPKAHMSPLPAMLTASPALTTMWSKTRTPTSLRASISSLVMARSAAEGSATPDGWLWLKMHAAALMFSAALNHPGVQTQGQACQHQRWW